MRRGGVTFAQNVLGGRVHKLIAGLSALTGAMRGPLGAVLAVAPAPLSMRST
ncbi:MAG: hypothetical protein H6Q91_1812, partial [Deltaproteobacteria bacterium]|nr:hypothetical protein [Deltaproteobacteria bacterium]